MSTIKKNFFYSTILTTSSYVMQLITYPYVTRVLGVEKIGLCNFADSIIAYMTLLSMLGIGTVGIREVAKSKGESQTLNGVYDSLLVLNGLSTFLAVVVLLVATFNVPQLYAIKELMFVGAVKIVANYLNVEWLFKGLEDFKYITLRSVFVKFIYVVSVFLFVKSKDDYFIYFALYCGTTLVSCLISLVYARRFVHFSFRLVSLSPYVKPMVTVGAYMLLTSMYTSFNVVFLGFVAGETHVGYYTIAIKLYGVLLGLFSALMGVMMPRMSSLIAEGKLEEFKQLLHRSINVLTTFSIPLIFFSIVFAPQIILVLSGSGYEGAILPMRIVMPLVFIIGYEQILVIETLMPLKKDKSILINSILGATVGLTLNLLLVPHLKSVGSACVWLATEFVVLLSSQYFVTKSTGLRLPIGFFLKNIMVYIPMLLMLIPICLYIENGFVSVVCGGCIMLAYAYILNMYVLKNDEFMLLQQSVREKLIRR